MGICTSVGRGRARFGGRWNPIGAATIYAANELSTAWADLTDEEVLRDLRIAPAVHECQWRAELDQGQVPETHGARKKLLVIGYDGVVYPSFMSPGGTCVALWRWNTPGMPTLKVIDPEERLPKDAASWL